MSWEQTFKGTRVGLLWKKGLEEARKLASYHKDYSVSHMKGQLFLSCVAAHQKYNLDNAVGFSAAWNFVRKDLKKVFNEEPLEGFQQLSLETWNNIGDGEIRNLCLLKEY